MKAIREVLRLVWGCKLKMRQVSRCLGVGKTTIKDYLDRAKKAGLSWPLPDMDDAELEKKLFPVVTKPGPRARPLPDLAEIRQELMKKSVTLSLLWHEYKLEHPDGLQYSQFCDRYRKWKRKQDLVMRQTHKVGEKLFVDYGGETIPYGNEKDLKRAQIFVGVLGASNYTYAEATESQALQDWVGSHCRTFRFLGGVPEIVVPDNLKSGVSKACAYEPELNGTYQDMARHYQTAIIPARVRKPKDKAKAEVGVQFVQRWIVAALRNRQFQSLEEINREIKSLLVRLNDKPFKKLPGSRRELFESLEKTHLKPLPKEDYEFAQWKKERVGLDYHVEWEGHHYSVPHQLVDQEIEIRTTKTTVEIYNKGKRVASHGRNSRHGGQTTLREHMPRSHRSYAEWDREKVEAWAKEMGPSVERVVNKILDSKPHPIMGIQACRGLFTLMKGYGNKRLEAACQRALHINGSTYTSIKSILELQLDRQPLPQKTVESHPPSHPNVRGPHYYFDEKEPGHVAQSDPR